MTYQKAAENWGAEEWRAPAAEPEDEIIFSECGRIFEPLHVDGFGYGLDCRSHYFRVVRRFCSYFLLVQHGGGFERMALDGGERTVCALERLESDSRYTLLHALYRMQTEGRRRQADETAATYRKAFAEGRLKKRKLAGRDVVKIWIEPARLGTRVG